MSSRGMKQTINQSYSNWGDGPEFARLEARANTFDILITLDKLESEVYSDRNFTLANKLIEDARRRFF